MITVLNSLDQPVCGLTKDDITDFCIVQAAGKEDCLRFRIHPNCGKYR